MKTNEKELTSEQEDLINDCHEKRFIEEMEEEEKKHKVIPINPDKFDQILIRIGRKKQNLKKEIKEVNFNE